MKKITFLILSVFVTINLMAQLQMTAPTSHNVPVNSTKATALYSQMTADVLGYASQEFPDFSDSRLESADDFVVPTGGWDITLVETYEGSGSSDLSSTFIIEIYADNAGLPGTLLHSQTGLPFTKLAGIISIPLTSTVQLTPGTYWISIMIDQNFTSYGQWWWTNHTSPQIGYEFSNQDPDQLLFGAWPVSWDSGSTTIGGLPSYDFCFALYGSPPVPVSNWALAIGLLLISGFIVIRFRRRLA